MSWAGFYGKCTKMFNEAMPVAKRMASGAMSGAKTYRNNLDAPLLGRSAMMGFKVGGFRGAARGVGHWATRGNSAQVATRVGTMAAAGGLMAGGMMSGGRDRRR